MQYHFISVHKNSFLLFVKVTPNFKTNTIIGIFNHINKTYLKVGINSIPEKNKANLELIKFFANYFKIPKNSIAIKSGETSTFKVLSLPLEQLDIIKTKLNQHLLKN